MVTTTIRHPTAPERHRMELLPLLVKAFSRWGYRKTTTARLAECCGVQEVELYRAWPSKREMFMAAIDHVFEQTRAEWEALLPPDEKRTEKTMTTMAQRLLSHQSLHQGDHGLYRIIFAGLSELDAPDIRRAMRRLYRKFHRYVVQLIEQHRSGNGKPVDAKAIARDAWAMVGLAAVCDIGRSLGMLKCFERHELMAGVGKQLLEGVDDSKR